MSWNFAAVLISDPPSLDDVIEALNVGPASGKKTNFAQATGMQNDYLSVAVKSGWMLVVDATYEIACAAVGGDPPGIDQALIDLSKGRTVIPFITFGVSSVYGFAIFQDGEVRRRWLSGEEAPELDEGSPLPEETGIDRATVEDTTIHDFLARISPFGDFFTEDKIFVSLTPPGKKKKR